VTLKGDRYEEIRAPYATHNARVTAEMLKRLDLPRFDEPSLGEQINALNDAAGEQRRLDEHTAAPLFEETQKRLREMWQAEGRPALLDLQKFAREHGAELEAASRIDFDALRRSGIDRANRLQPAEDLIDLTRTFLEHAIRQLEAIPQRIEGLTLEGKLGTR